MIAVDTNVLLRWMLNDDEMQATKARKLLFASSEETPVFAERLMATPGGREQLLQLLAEPPKPD